MSLTLVRNINVATMTNPELGIILNAAVVLDDDKIAWVGSVNDLPATYQQIETRIDGEGGLLTPGLIDCHTHLVWAGSRANEFSQRLHGASYEDIAKQGGGIISTVKATRAASEDELYELARERACTLITQGVTQIEIKSGYGLDMQTELKQLRVARRLEQTLPVSIRTTFLAAHALPPEYKGRADDYIDFVCDQVLPAAHAENLVDAVDVFCERIGFSREQTERVFSKAKQLGLPVKLHAEQLSDQDGAALVADYQGLSADHLEYLSDSGIQRMKEAGTVAVLLPGAFYFLRETKLPPIESLRRAGVPIAIATDANPGSSPIHNLPLMLNMACTLFRLTPEEALAGVTSHAATALGSAQQGTIEVGKQADLALWKVRAPAELCYQFGVNPLQKLWQAGTEVTPEQLFI
ncbi:imidazolonepropionase [Aliidiomarina minuta]|uniref:Imidazolonepropionase n=1 Tax=Aliidiomarina minuta TaxID=880057 RepID=A0A432W3H1_9GAMM|nr:imidazolonepropionase [Aliidiomarina minuta]RUO23887.1 imidazolonepropionase [Aliidiomarina minuta]